MKIATFNVNSLKVRLPVVLAWLAKHQPDVLALQEIKLQDAAFPIAELTAAGWHAVWHGQSTYNGVALISKLPATNVVKSLGDGVNDPQARLIAAEFAGVTVLNTYVPQGQEITSDKFAYKLAWLDRVRAFIERSYTPEQPLAWVGDFNVAVEDIDCYAPDFFEGQVSVHPDERARLEAIRAWGFSDCFRALHPGEKKRFTFFDYRTRDAVKYRKGWRIDHIWASKPLAAKLKACDIDMATREPEGASDHAPLWAEFAD